jgi:hypothetical protein
MESKIDVDAILIPIPGGNPAGEDLRYLIYDDIKEAMREQEPDPQFDWPSETMKADWENRGHLHEDLPTI